VTAVAAPRPAPSPAAANTQAVAPSRRHRAAHSRPAGASISCSQPRHEDEPECQRGRPGRHERHRRAHRRRKHQEDRDRQHDLHDLAGGAFPEHGPHGATHIAHLATVTDTAVDVAGDAARQREVEEQGPVVGRDGGAQREADPEPAGHDRPPPGREDRRDEDDTGGRQHGADVHRLHTGEERAGAEPPEHDPERHHRDRRAAPTTDPAHGSTSRSAWPTVTARTPASASRTRRRR
jgi:hypothetical protein